MDLALKDLGEYLVGEFPDEILGSEVAFDQLTIKARHVSIAKVLTFLRDNVNCQFKLLVDICGADYPEREQRFEVVYNLLSLTHNNRIRVKVATDEQTPVPSATGVFSAANWFEREAWDLFGIYFSDHPDLRRILLPDDWDGYPLRKDYVVQEYYHGMKVPY